MKTKLLFIAIISIVLTACNVGRVADAQVYTSAYTNIPLAPNIVLTVEVPVVISPSPNHIWIDGYWAWDYQYREYIWVQGYWTLAPYTGAYWIPGYWEHYRGGYRWVDACWLPRDYQLHYGYYDGRYDYYGRPVYYHQPQREIRHGYSYSYDHRPEYRGRSYSSSSRFNEAPKSERNKITKEYNKESRSSSRSASTKNNKQESIRIRNDNDNPRRNESATSPERSDSRRQDTNTNSDKSKQEQNKQPARSERQPENNNSSRSRNTQVKPNENNSNSKQNERTDSKSNSNPRSSSGSTSGGRR